MSVAPSLPQNKPKMLCGSLQGPSPAFSLAAACRFSCMCSVLRFHICGPPVLFPWSVFSPLCLINLHLAFSYRWWTLIQVQLLLSFCCAPPSFVVSLMPSLWSLSNTSIIFLPCFITILFWPPLPYKVLCHLHFCMWVPNTGHIWLVICRRFSRTVLFS